MNFIVKKYSNNYCLLILLMPKKSVDDYKKDLKYWEDKYNIVYDEHKKLFDKYLNAKNMNDINKINEIAVKVEELNKEKKEYLKKTQYYYRQIKKLKDETDREIKEKRESDKIREELKKLIAEHVKFDETEEEHELDKIKVEPKTEIKKYIETYDEKMRKENALKDKLYYIESQKKSEIKKAYKVMGTTGNIYTVTLSNKIGCSCPDYKFRHKKCKHIYFVLIKLLKLKDVNQEAFTTEELADLLNRKDINDGGVVLSGEKMLKYKKLVNGNIEIIELEPKTDDLCPICMDDITNGEEYTHCKYSCGKCIHTDCLNTYNKNKGTNKITKCLMCTRDFNVKPSVECKMENGYINLS